MKLRSLLTGALLLASLPSAAHAYNDDFLDPATSVNAYHSTFHYELTRTLLRAAGFTANEAERIAVTCEATDWVLFVPNKKAPAPYFVGETGIKVSVANTSRKDAKMAPFWHFPRRGTTDSAGKVTYAAPDAPDVKGNTCDYFTTQNQCQAAGPELSVIDAWAVYGKANAITNAGMSTPTVKVNGTAISASRLPGSIYAFGIFLHSLGDSYSHEPCMQSDQFNYHPEQLSTRDSEYSEDYPHCASENVHGNARPATEVAAAEFADGRPDLSENQATSEWTKAAARAVYAAARNYLAQKGWKRTEMWSAAYREEFIDAWADLETAADRAQVAKEAYGTTHK